MIQIYSIFLIIQDAAIGAGAVAGIVIGVIVVVLGILYWQRKKVAAAAVRVSVVI